MEHTWPYLLDRYLANTISREELTALLQMAEDEKEYPELNKALKEYWEQCGTKQQERSSYWDARFYAITEKEAANNLIPKQSSRKWLRRISSAAAVLLILSAGYYFFFPATNKPASIQQPVVSKDVAAPASNNAVLLLANGRQIVLDTAATGSLAMQGNITIQKGRGGEIVYTGEENSILQYNTLTVPRGSRIAGITLSDGTKVWLNAGSSLRYPVSFKKEERRVEITGEAYFEVKSLFAKSGHTKIPFIVETNLSSGNNGEIAVLGTHFNVNAYEDEKDIKVTLLEGAVKVNQGTVSKILHPGEQATIITSTITVADEIDVEEVMAWKNGKFQFGEAADINMIMRQISRWYDVDIEYLGKVEGHIGGSITREQNVSKVLNMLEMTGAVQFTIEGRKISVKSEKK